MTRAHKVKKLTITTPNEVGTLGHITEGLASSGINILHLCGYVKEDKGYFILITNNNKKVAHLMKEMGYEVGESETLEIEFENRPGTLAPVAKKLGENGVDIEYVFGTSADGKKVLGIISTNDDDMALRLINE